MESLLIHNKISDSKLMEIGNFLTDLEISIIEIFQELKSKLGIALEL